MSWNTALGYDLILCRWNAELIGFTTRIDSLSLSPGETDIQFVWGAYFSLFFLCLGVRNIDSAYYIRYPTSHSVHETECRVFTAARQIVGKNSYIVFRGIGVAANELGGQCSKGSERQQLPSSGELGVACRSSAGTCNSRIKHGLSAQPTNSILASTLAYHYVQIVLATYPAYQPGRVTNLGIAYISQRRIDVCFLQYFKLHSKSVCGTSYCGNPLHSVTARWCVLCSLGDTWVTRSSTKMHTLHGTGQGSFLGH